MNTIDFATQKWSCRSNVVIHTMNSQAITLQKIEVIGDALRTMRQFPTDFLTLKEEADLIQRLLSEILDNAYKEETA